MPENTATNSASVAYSAIQRIAKRRQAEDPHLSDADAIGKAALETPDGSWWYDVYKKARRQGEAIIKDVPAAPPVTKHETSPRAQAWRAIQEAAQAIRKLEAHVTEAEAITRVVTEQPVLYERFRDASGGRR